MLATKEASFAQTVLIYSISISNAVTVDRSSLAPICVVGSRLCSSARACMLLPHYMLASVAFGELPF
jgi:hypothetical protein